MTRRAVAAVLRVLLALVAAAALLGPGPATATAGAQQTALGGFQGSAAASGLHALYMPQGLLPTSPPVDFGAPDALATIASGPATFARASVADPGDLLANPDALLALGSSDWEPGTIPPYPYRVTASSGVGAPTAESSPAPGLNARVAADGTGSHAQATMPALDAPAVMTVGSMASTATTTTDGASVTVHAQSVTDDVDILGIVVIESIVTDLTATSQGQGTTLTGGTTVTGASVLGQPVTIDAAGIHPGAPGSAPPNPLLAGLFQGLNDVLANAGIRITVAGPVEQAGATSGQLASTGLRVDLEFSDRTFPELATLADALPPLENPIPGAPGIEDVIAVARARHLVAIQVGRGAVSLTARPRTPAVAAAPTSAPPRPTVSSRPASTPGAAPPASRPTSSVPVATTATPAPAQPVLEAAPTVSLGEGIGGLALLALMIQPFLGDRLARLAGIVLASDATAACPREGR